MSHTLSLARSLLVVSIALAGCKKKPATTPSPTPTVTPRDGGSTTTPSTSGNTDPGTSSTPSTAGTEDTGPAITQGSNGESSVVSVPDKPATGCPATVPYGDLGVGTVHSGTVPHNETWTLAGSPHKLPEGINIASNATLTIEPCARILIASGRTVNIDEGGSLIAAGDAAHPIAFDSDNATPQAGDWSGIAINEKARTTTKLGYVTVANAGHADADSIGCLANALSGLDAQHITLQNCLGQGVSLNDHGRFAASAVDITIRGQKNNHQDGGGGLYIVQDADAVSTIPVGTYENNETSEIVVRAGVNQNIQTTGTWHTARYTPVGGAPDGGQLPVVPYHIRHNVVVEGGSGPVLTIEPSSVLKFDDAVWFTVGTDAAGALVADGQSDATRITFTGSAPEQAPGKWGGVYFDSKTMTTRTKLNYVNIEYGGGNPYGCSCAVEGTTNEHVLLCLRVLPAPTSISHVRFVGVQPDGAGVGSGWQGADLDLTAPALGNDFAALGASCKQLPGMNSAGGCPETPKCF